MRKLFGLAAVLAAGVFPTGPPPLAASVIVGESEAFGVAAGVDLSGGLVDARATVSPTPLS